MLKIDWLDFWWRAWSWDKLLESIKREFKDGLNGAVNEGLIEAVNVTVKRRLMSGLMRQLMPQSMRVLMRRSSSLGFRI